MRCVSWPPLRPVTRGEEGPSPPWGCNRRATKTQAKFGATRRAAGLFRPDFVARSLQIHCGICSSLTPRLGEKSLDANVIVLMPAVEIPIRAQNEPALRLNPVWER